MESRGLPNREKKLKRREILEKKKAIDELIKAASAQRDHLTSFHSFRHYERNGLSVVLESGCGDKLSSAEKQYVQSLLKANMEGPYGSEWPAEEKVKRREMVAPEARYIFVREVEAPNASPNEVSKVFDGGRISCAENKGSIVGFVHFRFTVQEDVPVLYVYELQLEPRVQRKGLGKFLMQLIELIAHKNRMGAVMLTVQKVNLSALNFYTSKLRYIVSSISPSRVDPLTRVEKSYEILCKVFDNESKAALEE
ncbi:N-alpha-acetyltransferase 40 [Melia azedarach]|uniref:N-alpha-acetyltransferase 40 n=1 Tax=Melia azedarach TaxID=155640 RepID=A0ACC1XT37_MELAZ|nr:N-alpha-acetyltransferase 40 [Melia azedarach]